MGNSRLTGMVSLSLIGVLIVTACNSSVDTTVNVSRLMSDHYEAKLDLIDRASDGRLLYIRSEDYALERVDPSDYPDKVILEI